MRVLHVTHHDGCGDDLAYVGAQLGLAIDHYHYPGGYNIGPARAEAAWAAENDRFRAYDVVITSDTAPLARIFLQNGWDKGLVIWICNRFDYSDEATNDCGFPDPDYYRLFAAAVRRPRTVVIAYTAFEHHYARGKGIPLGSATVKPIGRRLSGPAGRLVPPDIDRAATCFIPPYHNDRAAHLNRRCAALGIAAYSGRYAGPSDLAGFKAVVHVPYAWSNFALFENLEAGLPYLIPSRRLLMELAGTMDFFWSPPFRPDALDLAEWYAPEHAELFSYFDSWEELGELAQCDLAPRRAAIAAFCERHAADTLARWGDVFGRVG